MTAVRIPNATDEKTRPALHVQVGSVRIAIWRNATEDGTEYYKAGSPELSYKDREGQWQAAKSWGERDLINLGKAALLAHTELLQRNRAEPSPGDGTEPDEAPEPGL